MDGLVALEPLSISALVFNLLRDFCRSVKAAILDWVMTSQSVWLPELGAFVVYSLLTILITYPLAFHFTSVLPVHQGDTYQHLWSLWWTKKALLDLHTNPANLTYLYFPTGIYHPLLWVTPYVHLISIPLQPLFGLIGTYNVLLLLSFPLCGLTMYLLAHYLTGDRSAAFIAGLIFAFFPNKTIQIAGHYLQLMIYWFPLYVLYLFKLFRSPSRKNTVWCGIFLGLSCLIHTMHTAYFVAPVTIIFLIYHFFAETDRLSWLRFVQNMAIAGVIALTIMAPFYVPYVMSSLNGLADYIYVGGDTVFCSDFFSFFVPFELHPLWKHIEPVRDLARRLLPRNSNVSESLAYVGWLPLGLALIGVYARRRKSTMWWTLSLTAAILSLGPLLHVNGHLVNEKFDGLSSYVVLPYAVLDRLPFYKWGRTPGRFNETVMFGLAILAAFGTQWLTSRIRSARLRWTGLTIITLLIVFEYLAWWPVPVFAPPTSTFYENISGGPDDAILTFPSFYRHDVRGIQPAQNYNMFFQTIHEHKMTGGYIWRWAPTQRGQTIALDELLMPERDIEIVSFPPDNDAVAILNHCGIRYVVVHEPYKREAGAALRQIFGPPIFEDTLLLAFKVPDHPPPNPDRAAMMYIGPGWYGAGFVDGIPWRWMENNAHLYVERLTAGYVRLSFQAIGSSDGWLDLMVNGQRVQTFPIHKTPGQYVTEPFVLDAGRNLLIFHTPDLCLNGEEDCWSMKFANLALEPISFAVDNPVDVNLDGDLSLVRFGQSQETVYPSGPLTVTLTWRAQAAVAQDYKVFVHLMDSNDHLAAQHDAEPDRWGYPTSQWVPGALVRDVHPLSIPHDILPGTYYIQTGMYLEETMERLPVSDSSEPSRNNVIIVGTVEVLPPDE